MKKISQFKFKTQLYIYFLSVIAFLMIGITITLFFVLKNTMYRKEINTLQNQSKQIAINIENKINYYTSYLEIFSQNEELKKRLGNEDKIASQSYLEEITKEFCYFNAGKINEITIYESDNADEQLIKGNIVFSGTYLNNRNEKVFSIKKQVIAAKTNKKYVIDLKVYETELFSLFNEDKSGNSILISQKDGFILSFSKRDEWNSILRQKMQIPDRKIPKSKNEIEINTTSKYGWNILIRTSTGYLAQGYLTIIKNLVSLFLIVVFLVIVLVSFITKQLNLRLKLLQENIASIGSQNFYKNVKMEGEDEFSALSDEVDHI